MENNDHDLTDTSEFRSISYSPHTSGARMHTLQPLAVASFPTASPKRRGASTASIPGSKLRTMFKKFKLRSRRVSFSDIRRTAATPHSSPPRRVYVTMGRAAGRTSLSIRDVAFFIPDDDSSPSTPPPTPQDPFRTPPQTPVPTRDTLVAIKNTPESPPESMRLENEQKRLMSRMKTLQLLGVEASRAVKEKWIAEGGNSEVHRYQGVKLIFTEINWKEDTAPFEGIRDGCQSDSVFDSNCPSLLCGSKQPTLRSREAPFEGFRRGPHVSTLLRFIFTRKVANTAARCAYRDATSEVSKGRLRLTDSFECRLPRSRVSRAGFHILCRLFGVLFSREVQFGSDGACFYTGLEPDGCHVWADWVANVEDLDFIYY
ncbi:hypothetical protein B0H10DRAFT_1955358 [Mycena sp. CBHHK59/15]|nr:hypothetical protein B0H10DRAFT_1955358 [Mycena sp. CBHHK59/15]